MDKLKEIKEGFMGLLLIWLVGIIAIITAVIISQ